MKRRGSKLEAKFVSIWSALDGPELVREHRFHPIRKWRFDFAHLPTKTAVEVEGGVWSGGRHTTGTGFVKDCEKYLEAQLMGWRVVRLAAPLITAENCQRVKELIAFK